MRNEALGADSRRALWLAASHCCRDAIAARFRGGITSSEQPVYKDAAAPIEQRVEDLLARMTQEEKIAQITAIWTQKPRSVRRRRELRRREGAQLYPAGIGQFARPNDLIGAGNPFQTPYRDAKQTVDARQRDPAWSISETRLGIPALFHEEGLHGYAARGATHFPQAIALASTWDPELLTRVFTVVAREIRARGVQLVLAPVVDVARDPRWGRIEETYGEDPYLVGELGVAAVRGFQGDSLPLGKDRVFATLKHMTGHGQPESGTNVGPASISERVLREVFLPAVRGGGEARQRSGGDAVVQRDRRRALARQPLAAATRSCARRWASKARSSATTAPSRS